MGEEGGLDEKTGRTDRKVMLREHILFVPFLIICLVNTSLKGEVGFVF